VARGDWPSDMPTTVSITPRAPRRWFSADVVLS
jgi:hypothetical protein